MATEFKLPDLGENIESADILSVLVAEGDTVRAEQTVLEIETDKATVEVPAPVAGTVTTIHVAPGDTVKIGAVLLTIDEAQAAPDHDAQPAETPDPAA